MVQVELLFSQEVLALGDQQDYALCGGLEDLIHLPMLLTNKLH